MTIKDLLQEQEKNSLRHFDIDSIKQNRIYIHPDLYFISSDMSVGTICRHVVNHYHPEKLNAVKCLKVITGQGLKETKDLVDSMW